MEAVTDTSSVTLGFLFLSTFLASTVLPGGSEAVFLAVVAAGKISTMVLLAVATAGNALGGMTSWALGRWLRRRHPDDSQIEPATQRALEWVRRRGSPVLLLSWVPVIGDALCVAAGWMRVPPLRTSVYVICGKAGRYGVLLLALDVAL